MIAANEVPEREIARLAGLLAHEAGADFAIKVLGNISRALAPMAVHERVQGRLSASAVMAEIVKRVALRHRLSVDDIMGESRRRHVSWPRQEAYAACYEMRAEQDGQLYSLPRIAAFFHRDHSSILHGVRAHYARTGDRDW